MSDNIFCDYSDFNEFMISKEHEFDSKSNELFEMIKAGFQDSPILGGWRPGMVAFSLTSVTSRPNPACILSHDRKEDNMTRESSYKALFEPLKIGPATANSLVCQEK
jgi:hypothetical protein